MMDFGKMKMTHEQIGDQKYRIRVGNDIIEVELYFDFHGYFRVATLNHYIKHPGNKPTNPNRTQVLEVYVDEYLETLYLKELEEDLREIAAFPNASCLKEDYNGHWLRFYKGTSADQVIREFENAYNACVVIGGDTYFILKELSQMPDGFLSEKLDEMFNF